MTSMRMTGAPAPRATSQDQAWRNLRRLTPPPVLRSAPRKPGPVASAPCPPGLVRGMDFPPTRAQNSDAVTQSVSESRQAEFVHQDRDAPLFSHRGRSWQPLRGCGHSGAYALGGVDDAQAV